MENKSLINILAIPFSRAEDGDGLLQNIHNTIGIILTQTGPRLHETNYSLLFTDCEKLVHSVIMENTRQYLRRKVQNDPKTYDSILSIIANATGFSTYQNVFNEPNLSDILRYSENRLRAIARG